MKITEYNIGDLKPYDRNPRNNVAAIDYVANSIVSELPGIRDMKQVSAWDLRKCRVLWPMI